MLNRREKILLQIMVWVIIAAVFGVFLFFQLVRNAETKKDIALLEQQLARWTAQPGSEEDLLTRKAALLADLSDLENRFYVRNDMDPFRFGILVRDLLAAHRLEINRYQTIESGGNTILEFAVQGDALNLVEFLKQVELQPRYWSVSFLSIRTQTESSRINAVFRVGYEVLDAVAD
jgi:hypothetical protein